MIAWPSGFDSCETSALPGYDRVTSLGTNAKMSELAAAMGLTSLDQHGDDRRRQSAATTKPIASCLRSLPGLTLLPHGENETSNYQYVVVEVDAQRRRPHARRAGQRAQAENVLARRYFSPGCHRMEPYCSDPLVAPRPLPSPRDWPTACSPCQRACSSTSRAVCGSARSWRDAIDMRPPSVGNSDAAAQLDAADGAASGGSYRRRRFLQIARQARIGRTTLPLTSVRRKSRPAWRKVSRSWSKPSVCRIVACRSWMCTAVFDDVEAQVVGLAVDDARLDAAAGHPHREGLRMMVAAQLAAERRVALDHRRAAEFASPDHERFVQQAPLLEVQHQCGRALVGGPQFWRWLPFRSLWASQPS